MIVLPDGVDNESSPRAWGEPAWTQAGFTPGRRPHAPEVSVGWAANAMDDVIFGLLAIVAGAVFCFRGYLAFQVVIPLWGAFVGFGFGAGMVAGIAGDGFLQTGLGWIVGLACAFVFAVVAYLFYWAAVVIAMGSIGFVLGASAMVALDVSWTWVVILVGVALGALLAFAAIAADLPMVLLIVLSALGGASAITTGIMLLVGTVNTDEFRDGAVTTDANSWWTYVVFGVLVVAGLVVQIRGAHRMRGSMREAWATRRDVAAV